MSQERRKPFLYLIVVLIIVGLCLFGLTRADAIKNHLHAWKMLPEPERLTELYFTNHGSLPASYKPGQMQQFSFTVRNLEYGTKTYVYRVIEQNADGSQIQELTRGSFQLGSSQSKTTPIAIEMTDLGPSTKVVVDLTGQNESIYYWVKRG